MPERDRGGTAPAPALPAAAAGLVVTDRLCWAILALGMAVAASLILYLNRGTTFFLDELGFLHASSDLDASGVIEPYAGHLIATTRLAYKAILETFGAEYAAFRVLGASSVLLCVGIFYALVKRRIGSVPALAPAFVLLFFGSAWSHVVVPIGFTVIFSVAAGLAALLALDRGDRRGDAAACALACLSVATYSVGLAFLVGVAISVLIRSDRARRAWVFLVPLALYAAWWVHSLSSPGSVEGELKLSNALLFPAYAAESLAMVGAALTGLGYGFEAESPPTVALGWGPIIALVGVVALALRIGRGGLPALLWVSLGVVLTYWMIGTLVVGELRAPAAVRYVYPGSVGILLVAVAAASGIRFSRLGLAALLAVTAVSLAGNVALLRDGAAYFRDGYSGPVRAQLAMLELAEGHVDADFDPANAVTDGVALFGGAGSYLAAVNRYGSPAFSPSELELQPETVRRGADEVLAAALRLALEPSPPPPRERDCLRIGADLAAGTTGFELPAGGATIGVAGDAPASLTLGRFAGSTTVEVGSLEPGETAMLRLPRDSSPRPWRASVTGAAAVRVCAGP